MLPTPKYPANQILSLHRLVQEGEEAYNQLFEGEFTAKLLVDLESLQVDRANLRAGEILGCKPEDLGGLELHELFLTNRPLDDILHGLLHGTRGKAILENVLIRRRRGRRFPADAFFGAIEMDGRRKCIISFHDVTERQEARRTLEYHHHMLERQVALRTRQLARSRERLMNEVAVRRKAEAALRASSLGLERRVKEKTAELSRANRELLQEMSQRRALEKQMLEVREVEQRRIGQDLHDDLCQQLAALKYRCEHMLSRARRKASMDPSSLEEVIRNLDELLSRTRVMSRGLSPINHSPDELADALRQLAAQFSGTGGVECRFRAAGRPAAGDVFTATQLYRIAQESIRNALRHGKATRISLSLLCTSGRLSLVVSDNGRGIQATPRPHPNGGTGLRIMQHRASLIRASLTVKSGASRGTTVTCSIELPSSNAATLHPNPSSPEPTNSRRP